MTAIDELSALLAPKHAAVARRVALAARDPEHYAKRWRARLEDRNFEDDPVDPFLELVDALEQTWLACGIDWKFAAEDIVWNLTRVLGRKKLPAKTWFAFYDEDAHIRTKTFDFIELCGTAFSAFGWALVDLYIEGDSYSLTVVPRSALAKAQSLAKRAGGKLIVHGAKKPLAAPLVAATKKPRGKFVAVAIAGADGSGRHSMVSGFPAFDDKSSTLVDCRTWPPKKTKLRSPKIEVVERSDAGARALFRVWHQLVDREFLPKPLGTFVVEVGRKRTELIDRLPLDFDPWGAGFVGDRLVVFPTEPCVRGGRTKRPLVWNGKSIAPAKGLPDAKPIRGSNRNPFPSFMRRGFARTGSGIDLLLWEGRGWTLEGDRFSRAFDLARMDTTYEMLIGAPGDGDAFFYRAAAATKGVFSIREVRREGKKWIDRERARFARYFEHLKRGPDGTLVMIAGRYGDPRAPVLLVHHLETGEWKQVPPTAFGVRKDDGVSAFGFGKRGNEDFVWVLDQRVVKMLPWSSVLATSAAPVRR